MSIYIIKKKKKTSHLRTINGVDKNYGPGYLMPRHQGTRLPLSLFQLFPWPFPILRILLSSLIVNEYIKL